MVSTISLSFYELHCFALFLLRNNRQSKMICSWLYRLLIIHCTYYVVIRKILFIALNSY